MNSFQYFNVSLSEGLLYFLSQTKKGIYISAKNSETPPPIQYL